MTDDSVGRPRMEIAPQRLRELNPHVEVEAVAENITEENVARLVGRVDLVAACAPLFRERLLLNREAVRQNKPLVDCAMYDLELQLTTVLPGRTPCLACLYPRSLPAGGASSRSSGRRRASWAASAPWRRSRCWPGSANRCTARCCCATCAT